MTPALPQDRAWSPAAGLSRTTMSVRIAKPPEVALGEWMSQLRSWFDRHGIEPNRFQTQPRSTSRPEFYEVSFRDATQADLFAAEFTTRSG
ncbi:MAG: hypothetical protein JO038_07635 [Alphaproteobacteria bacterium]|nr:hypothetical protein [Alphaproteobacteria bacterium]